MPEQLKMSEHEERFWWDTIENRKTLMAPHHERWRQLYRRYRLKGINIAGVSDDEIVKISRLYPMVRKIVNGIGFNYPEIFMELEDQHTFGPGLEEVLEMAANDGMRRMEMKPHVRQGLVDAIFCYRAWWKVELANDSVSGVLSTRDIENFVKFQRVDPFKVFVDPGTLPHAYKSTPNIIEEMDIPLGYLLESPRFAHAKDDLAALAREEKSTLFEDTFGEDMAGHDADRETREGIEQARKLQRLTTCYEIHDRMKGHRKFLIRGGSSAAGGSSETKGLLLENIDHPFLEAESVKARNPFSGEEQDVEYTRPKGARFFIEGGLPYFTDAYDLSDLFYGEPLAAYEEQIEKLTMESQSRRADALQRFKRIIIGDVAAKEDNPQFPQDLKKASDGSILWANVPPGKSIRDLLVPADWGTPQADQVQLERDAKVDEAHLINVDAPGGNTATESAITAGPAELNRAAMQVVPVNAYAWGIGAVLDINAQDRYANEQWFDSLARKGNVSPDVAIMKEWMRIKRQVKIHAASMTPFAAELQRDAVLAFGDRYIQHPLVDPRKIIIQTAQAMNLPDPEGVLRAESNVDAVRAAFFELINYAFIGQPMPSPVRGEDHQTHMQIQDPQAVQAMPEFRNLVPQLQQIALQQAQAHLVEHQGLIDEEAAGTGGPVAVSKPDSNVSRSSSADSDTSLTSKVRSDAQENANLIQTNTKDRGVI